MFGSDKFQQRTKDYSYRIDYVSVNNSLPLKNSNFSSHLSSQIRTKKPEFIQSQIQRAQTPQKNIEVKQRFISPQPEIKHLQQNSKIIEKDFLSKPIVVNGSDVQKKIQYPSFISDASLVDKNKHLEHMNLYYREIISMIQNNPTEYTRIQLLTNQLDNMSRELAEIKTKNYLLENEFKRMNQNEPLKGSEKINTPLYNSNVLNLILSKLNQLYQQRNIDDQEYKMIQSNLNEIRDYLDLQNQQINKQQIQIKEKQDLIFQLKENINILSQKTNTFQKEQQLQKQISELQLKLTQEQEQNNLQQLKLDSLEKELKKKQQYEFLYSKASNNYQEQNEELMAKLKILQIENTKNLNDLNHQQEVVKIKNKVIDQLKEEISFIGQHEFRSQIFEYTKSPLNLSTEEIQEQKVEAKKSQMLEKPIEDINETILDIQNQLQIERDKNKELSKEILEVVNSFPLKKEVINETISKYKSLKLILKSLIRELRNQQEDKDFELDTKNREIQKLQKNHEIILEQLKHELEIYKQECENLRIDKRELIKKSRLDKKEGDDEEIKALLKQINDLKNENQILQQKISSLRQHVLGKKSRMIKELNSIIQTKSEFQNSFLSSISSKKQFNQISETYFDILFKIKFSLAILESLYSQKLSFIFASSGSHFFFLSNESLIQKIKVFTNRGNTIKTKKSFKSADHSKILRANFAKIAKGFSISVSMKIRLNFVNNAIDNQRKTQTQQTGQLTMAIPPTSLKQFPEINFFQLHFSKVLSQNFESIKIITKPGKRSIKKVRKYQEHSSVPQTLCWLLKYFDTYIFMK